MYRMTNKQKAWFKQATEEEKLSFLANAKEADFGQLLNREQNKVFYAPFIRGVHIDEVYETAKAALDRGNDLINEYRAMPDRVALDEVALGIDGANIRVAESLEDQTLRFDRVIYLGGCVQQDAWPDALRDFVEEDLDDHAMKTLLTDLPFMKEVVEALDENDAEGAREIFNEEVYRNSTFGFLVNVSQPVFSYHDESSASFSWGYTTSAWFYGENMQEITEKAVAWGAANIEEAKQETSRKKAKASV